MDSNRSLDGDLSRGAPGFRGPRWTAALLPPLSVGLAARLLAGQRTPLSFDEVFGALFALDTFSNMLIAVLRFDIHPPLWNVQLWGWAQVGASASWLRLNSTLWSLALIVLVWHTVRDRLGDRMATAAAWVLALLPQAVMTGAELRMYPMLTFLVVLGWYFLHGLLEQGRARYADVGLFLAQAAVLYTHGSGALHVFLLGIYALALIQNRRPSPERVRAWVKVELLVALLALPALANALVRRVAHTSELGVQQVLTDLAKLTFGRDWADPIWMIGLGVCVFAWGIVAGLRNPGTRPITAVYLVFGPLMVAALSLFVKPIWYYRTLSPWLPAFAIALGGAGARSLGRFRGAQLAALVALGLVTGRAVWVHRSPCDFRGPVSQIKEAWMSGDVVYTPLVYDSWSVAWHWGGGPWGSVLEVGDTDLPREGKWRTVLQGLTPEARRALRLVPGRNLHRFLDGDIYVGPGALDDLQARRPGRVHVLDSGAVPGLSGPLRLAGYEIRATHTFPDGIHYWRLEPRTSSSHP